MMIEDEQNNVNLKILQEKIVGNDNILKICFDFCHIDDILNLSLVSKKFYNNITKYFDYKFEDAIEKNYFSNHNNYE